jgi:hypothetical protein
MRLAAMYPRRPDLLCLVSSLCLAAALGLAACGGGGDDLLTVGEACTRISGPACDRAIACGQGPASDRQGCLNAFMLACCQKQGVCGKKADTADHSAQLETYIQRCSGAFPTWDCDRYNMGDAPPECSSAGAPLRLRDAPMSRLPAAEPFAAAAQLGRSVGQAQRSLQP